MNDRFTEKARNAIQKARAAAAELGHSYIGTEHLLLGVVRETDALGSRVLRENGFEEDLVLDLIEKTVGRGAPGMLRGAHVSRIGPPRRKKTDEPEDASGGRENDSTDA